MERYTKEACKGRIIIDGQAPKVLPLLLPYSSALEIYQPIEALVGKLRFGTQLNSHHSTYENFSTVALILQIVGMV